MTVVKRIGRLAVTVGVCVAVILAAGAAAGCNGQRSGTEPVRGR